MHVPEPPIKGAGSAELLPSRVPTRSVQEESPCTPTRPSFVPVPSSTGSPKQRPR